METKVTAVNGHGHLTIGGLDTVALASKYGTPLYVMDEDAIRANCRALKNSMDAHYHKKGLVLYLSLIHIWLALCGTRSWLFDAGQPHDEKVMSRECGRLRASLEAAGDTEKAVFLHYPPVYPQADAGEVVALLREYGVKRCFYGHLHGPSIPRAVQGELDGIEYKLISADALRFFPYKI